MSPHAGKVEPKMEGEAQEAVVEVPPPAFNRHAGCEAAVGGVGAVD